jgi:hypothetical protein
MWTAANWIVVASVAIIIGGLRFMATIRRRKRDSIKFSYADVLFYGFWGLEFGLLLTFRLQVFHRPLVFLVVLVFAGILVTGGRPLMSSQRNPH